MTDKGVKLAEVLSESLITDIVQPDAIRGGVFITCGSVNSLVIDVAEYST